MLAWVHQALASERELLLSLFGEPDADAMGDTGGASGDMPSIARLLDRVFESICKPLKVRSRLADPAACCVTLMGHSCSYCLTHAQVHYSTHRFIKPICTSPCKTKIGMCSMSATCVAIVLSITLATGCTAVRSQVRIEQVLISGPPLLLSFKLGQLLAFYRDTIEVR